MKEVETAEKKEVGKRPNNLGKWLKTGGKGRVPGSKNRITANIKADIQAVFQLLGGRKAMAEWAGRSDNNRALFYRMVVQILPKEVAMSANISHSTGLEKLSDEELIDIIKRGEMREEEVIETTFTEPQEMKAIRVYQSGTNKEGSSKLKR
jgi:hypothetical protein